MKAAPPKSPKRAASDDELVRRCSRGDQEAWSALVDKYKNLIFSIPVKYRFSQDDSAEIFQQVCLELLTHITTLRNPTGLPKWLMQVTAHRCFHFKQQQRRFVPAESETEKAPPAGDAAEHPLHLLQEAEREQALREALALLSPRCRELVQMLFFEETPRPYGDVAASLGIATGSIGFIRGRCLDKLRAQLEKAGFQ